MKVIQKKLENYKTLNERIKEDSEGLTEKIREKSSSSSIDRSPRSRSRSNNNKRKVSLDKSSERY